MMLLAGALLGAPALHAADTIDAMRGATPVGEETNPPLLAPVENNDVRRQRAYSMQPPTIPHKIDGYQVDRNFNRCLDCHARERTQETQAVPLSVTHYMNRDGNVLAEVSPRRYFCIQCHVPQADAKPLVGNSFRDVTDILRDAGQQSKKK
jgi:cytochrome c-type protein NapB